MELKFSDVKLYGRDNELQVLKDAWKRVVDNMDRGGGEEDDESSNRTTSPRIETVLVYGYSGRGKSRLIHTSFNEFQQEYCGDDNNTTSSFPVMVVGKGKFDQLLDASCKPYSALMEALEEVLQQLRDVFTASSSDDDKRKCTELRKSLKSLDLTHLYPMLKTLRRLCPPSSSRSLEDEIIGTLPSSAETRGRQQPESAQVQQPSRRTILLPVTNIGSALEALLGMLSSFVPIVLLIDDIQFGDIPTFDLLVRLATSIDLKSKPIGFCFAYRDNEIDTAHPWALRLERMEGITERIDLPN